jgi:hypothetical protein
MVLKLNDLEERLNRRIIIAVAFAAHCRGHLYF